MRRLCGFGYSTVITAALGCLPDGMRRFLGDVDILTGTDPLWAGLHFTPPPQTHGYEHVDYSGRTYRDLCHVVYPGSQRHLPATLRRTTIVLPYVPDIGGVIHELGHVLDERLGFTWRAAPVTDYAATNDYEAIAEAFAAYYTPVSYPWSPLWRRDNVLTDRATTTLFDRLASL